MHQGLQGQVLREFQLLRLPARHSPEGALQGPGPGQVGPAQPGHHPGALVLGQPRGQVGDHRGRCLIPVGRLLGQHPGHHLGQFQRERLVQRGHVRGLAHLQLGQLADGVPFEGRLAGDQGEERRPQAVDVRPDVHLGRTQRLLRRDVIHRTHHGPTEGLGHPVPGRPVGARQAHVEDLDHPVLGQDQVGRLDVPVDEPPFVGVLQPGRRLGHVGHRPGRRDRPAPGQQGVQGDAVDVLHDKVANVPVLAGVVDADDVRVVQGGRGPGLAQEPLGRHLGVGLRDRGKDLEGDGATQALVLGQVHGPHAALAELVSDEVLPHSEPLVLAGQEVSGLEPGQDPGLDEEIGRPVRVGRERGNARHTLVEIVRLEHSALDDETEQVGGRGRLSRLHWRSSCGLWVILRSIAHDSARIQDLVCGASKTRWRGVSGRGDRVSRPGGLELSGGRSSGEAGMRGDRWCHSPFSLVLLGEGPRAQRLSRSDRNLLVACRDWSYPVLRHRLRAAAVPVGWNLRRWTLPEMQAAAIRHLGSLVW